MTDEELVQAGMAGRLAAGTDEYERFVDLTARRPSGSAGVAHYRDPKEHEESFRFALRALQLRPEDVYLELGFGGGQLLRLALDTTRSAAGIDHSADMVELAATLNASAIRAGRLELAQGEADSLPWPDATFTCAAAVNMWFFVERPRETLSEVSRVLRPAGRFVIVTIAPGARSLTGGPWAAALRAYSTEEMESMTRAAGFDDVSVTNPNVGTQLVVAKKVRG